MRKRLRRIVLIVAAAAMLLTVVTGEYHTGYAGTMAGDGMGIYAHGLDLSAWQGHEVDFEKVRQQGYAFVILRVGYATDEDETFESNYARAKEAGLDVGAYLYSYAATPDGARAEAEACKQWLRGKQLEYPVYFDMEDPQIHEPMINEARTTLAMAFLDSMADDGWLCGLYSSMSWLTNLLDTDTLGAKYECWMAMYLPGGGCDTYERYHARFGMWQYTASGTVEGVPGAVDLNVAFKDYPSICREYGFNGYQSVGEPISLYGIRVPDLLATGETFAIDGRVASAEHKLTNVTVGIYAENGEMVTGRSVGPNASECRLSELAAGVKMQTLSAGTYEFRVTATDTATTRILLRQPLRIANGGVWLADCTPPQDLHVGERFTPSGTLTANETIQAVTLTVENRNGTVVCSAETAPNEKTYDLSATALNLTELGRGEYSYHVTVRTEKGRTELLDTDFTVWANDDPVTLTGFSLRQDRFCGEPLALQGLVSSKSSALDFVRVTIRRADGEIVASAETSEPQRQVLLSRLERALNAQALPVGSYVLTVEARNAGGPTELMRQSISVSSDAISLCEFTPPVLIECGESVPIRGVVASDTTRLRCVGITILNAQDRPVRQCAAVPDACIFDLSALDGELLLSSLEAGEYRMRVFAENEHGYAVLYDSPLTVTRTRDIITWEGERFSLGGRAYAAGEAVTLSGKLCSADSPLRSITAEIVNAEGEAFGTATLQTDGQECSAAALNQGLHTAALPAGEYSLTIRAENASGEYCVAFERFFVTECRHESVRSGLRYEPDCTGAGAICDSRCLFCGQSVRGGQLLPRKEHEMQDGACKRCGAAAYRTVTAKLCDGLPTEDGRYVIAACENDQWFALGKDGTAVLIVRPDVGGNISVGAELLWAAEEERNGIAFRNADGMRLHLDRNGPSAAPGTAHTLLSCRNDAEGLHLMLSGLQRSLAFEKKCFQTSGESTSLFLFKMVSPE